MENNTTKTCKKCGKTEELKFISSREVIVRDMKRPFIKKIYANKYGQKWCHNTCYDCTMAPIRKKRGTVARAKSKKPRMLAAVRNERIALRFFKRLGFKVVMGHGAGPDLFCELGPLMWTVEVKVAKRGPKKTKYLGTWRVERVRDSRKNDDLVAIVLPNKRVYIDSMRHHLLECGPSGDRTVTMLVKEYGGLANKPRRTTYFWKRGSRLNSLNQSRNL